MSSTAPLNVLVDARPLRGGLSGVGQYVLHLLLELGRLSEVEARAQTFDFLRRANPEVRDLDLEGAGVEEYRRQLLHRKVFNGVSAFLPSVPGDALGVPSSDVLHLTYFERFAVPRRTRSVVSTVHDVCFLRMPELFSSSNLAASRRTLDWQLSRSDVVLAVSEFTKNELVELAGADPERVLVTPLAATDITATPVVPEGRGRPYALYVGNAEPRKNLPRLLEGWAAAALGKRFDLVLVGAPLHLQEESMRAIESGAQSGVVHLGYVSAARKRSLLAGASCFVYPSLYEGFGIPVLEAMAAGTPVVASATPAIEEVAGGAARLVDPFDAGAIGGALRSVLDDPSLQAQLRTLGQRRASAFTWARTAELTVEGYRRALQV